MASIHGTFGAGGIKGLGSNFNSFLKGGQFGGEVVPFGAEGPIVSVIGGPGVLEAAAALHEAAEQAAAMARDAGQGSLADAQLAALDSAIHEALTILDRSAVAITDPEDPLYVPTLERLATQAG